MKKCIIPLIVILVTSLSSLSQTSTERIHIKGGSSAWENFLKEMYRYPAFQEGLVEYKNGKQYKGKLNYNKVLGAIQFLDEKGDTLSVGNEELINYVAIGNDVFYYVMPECLLEVKDGGKLKLVKNERIRIADKQKIGAMGISNSTGTIESIDRLDTKFNYNQIDINENLLLSKTTKFYLEKSKNELVPASKKNILSMFPKHEEAIKEYIRKKEIDFSNEDDLAELTGYLSQL